MRNFKSFFPLLRLSQFADTLPGSYPAGRIIEKSRQLVLGNVYLSCESTNRGGEILLVANAPQLMGGKSPAGLIEGIILMIE